MLDGTSGNLGIKQVEINTIASSFGGLSSQMGGLHKYFAFQLHYLISSYCKIIRIAYTLTCQFLLGNLYRVACFLFCNKF